MSEQRTNGKSNFGPRGWLLIILCLLTSFLCMGFAGSLNISTTYFNAAYGWSQTIMMLAFTIASIVAALMQFVGGAVLRRVSPRYLIIVCAAIYAVCFGLSGHSTKLWQFYLLLIIGLAAGNVWSFMGNATLIANWFPRKRGLAMGWVTMGMPLGTGVGAMVISTFSSRWGFSASYYPFAILAFVVALIELFCLKDFPAECGCYPDNDKNLDLAVLEKEEKMVIEARKNSPWTAGRIFATKEFWFIVLSIAFMLFCSGFMTQIVPTLLTYGLTQQTAVYVNLLVCVIACFGSWILGVVDTKQGSRRGMMITFVCLIGMGLLAQINYLPTKLVCFALLGIVVGGGSNFMLSSVMGYWGRTNGMKVYGFSQPCSQIISSFGSTIISAIAAAAGGNYNMSFLFIGILAVIGFILVFFIKDGFVEKREQKFK